MTSILVVDDDDSYVYLIERKLKSQDKNIDLKSCASGKEALDYIDSLRVEKKTPDIVLLDLNMPVMNGFDFLKAYEIQCKTHSVSIPPPRIWIVTSSNIQSDRDRARQFPSAHGFLVKPLGPKEIQELLSGR